MPRIAKVLLFISILTVCLTEIVARSVDPNFFGIRDIEPGMATSNSSNTSGACNFEIPELSLKDVLRLMHDSRMNVIKLNVWFELADNDTATNNKILLTDFHWANEVGRTVYSLINHHPSIVIPSLISSMSTFTLTAGVKNIDIPAYAENERCMRSAKKSTSENLIFNRLLKQLYRINDDDTNYQLCRSDKLVCCTMETIKSGKVLTKEILLCSEYYSSFVIHYLPFIFFAFMICFLYFAFPLIVRYIYRFKEESRYYMISDSPMALSFVMHTALIEGQSPIKSFVRRLLIAAFVIVNLLPVRNLSNWLWIVLFTLICPRALFFLFFEEHHFDDATHRPPQSRKLHYENVTELIGLPFNLKFWWLHWLKFMGNSTTSKRSLLIPGQERLTNEHGGSYESIPSIPQQSETNHEISNCKRSALSIIKVRLCILLFVIAYLVIFFPLSWFHVCSVLLRDACRSYAIKLYDPKNLMLIFKIFKYLLDIFLIVFSSYCFFDFILCFAIGLFLNGKTYGLYFVPFSTILFNSWINWKHSVEEKYLVLNTAIYEFCNECSPSVRTTHGVSGGEMRESSDNDSETDNNNNTPNSFSITLDDDGVPLIPRELYNKVREKFLPYDQVLVHYFTGVFFAIAFAFFLYILMSLSQKSGASDSVQVIGSISGAMLPIIFNLVWKKSSDEQRSANKMAMKSKVKRVLVVRRRSDDPEEIEVEVKI